MTQIIDLTARDMAGAATQWKQYLCGADRQEQAAAIKGATS